MMKRSTSIIVIALLVVTGIAILSLDKSVEVDTDSETTNQKLTISGVSHTPGIMDFSESDFSVRFHLSSSTPVSLQIFNLEDFQVAEVKSEGSLESGDNLLEWDGRDSKGKRVSSGVYAYILVADKGDAAVIHDLTDTTGGKSFQIQGIRYDPEQELIHFDMPKPGLVLLRAGTNENFLLKTVINNRPFNIGRHHVAWDGWDNSKVINLGQHPNLKLSANAWELSRNAFIVKSPVSPDDWVQPSQNKRAAQKKPDGLNIHYYFQRVGGHDPEITIQLLEEKSSKNGAPVLSGMTDIQIDVTEASRSFISTQRFETIFFMNGEMLHENETAYTPYTWRWDVSSLPPGEHILTAMLATFSGYFGSASLKFIIEE